MRLQAMLATSILLWTLVDICPAGIDARDQGVKVPGQVGSLGAECNAAAGYNVNTVKLPTHIKQLTISMNSAPPPSRYQAVAQV